MKAFVSLGKLFLFQFFPYVVVFTASLYFPNDSDLGWHLAYGEYFFQIGTILKENIFSTTMVGFPWVNSSWGTDLVTYSIFSQFGFVGLSVAAALVITLIFFFLSRAFRLTFWERALLFPIMLFMEMPMFEVSFRGHLLTLLFVAILYFLLRRYEEGKWKFLLLIPALFTLWANIHGAFILGLGLVGIWHGLYVVRTFLNTDKKDRVRKTLSAIRTGFLLLSASIAGTLIHPFGIKIYEESLKHFGNPLQRFIIEWLPFDRFSLLWWTLIAWELLIFVSFAVIIKEKKFTKLLPWIGAPVLLLILSFFVRRYTWPLILISLPLIRQTARIIKPTLDDVSTSIAVFIFVSLYGYYLFFNPSKAFLAQPTWNMYCEFIKCSPQSAEFLRSQILRQSSGQADYSGKLMTFYNWGGWIIWNYFPDIQPSIDGRMHLWQDEKGYSAFIEYYPYEQNWKDIDESSYDIVYMTTAKPVHRRLMELVSENKWSAPYSDPYATVFVRNKK